jgi:hypothetical protein
VILNSIYFIDILNSFILSKLVLKSLGLVPKIKKIIFYFILQSKEYKKNLILFYIIVSLIFSGIVVVKKTEISGLHVFKIVLKKKKICYFLVSFVYFYVQQFFINSSKKK